MQPATSSRDQTVYAAGSVLWRFDGKKLRVLVIHRNRHNDYSLAKGKVDPGESLAQTAAREIWEETGYRVDLGAPLGIIDYTLPSGRPKEVHYWSSEVSDEQFTKHKFKPNSEVDRLEWLSVKKAKQVLSYDRDKELLQLLAERYERGIASTFPIVLLRHATAIPAAQWPGHDETRPLTSRGLEQSQHIIPILRAFGPQRILTSTAARCRETVAPLADALGIFPESHASLSQNTSSGDAGLTEVLAEVLERREPVVLCSHSPVMPEVLTVLAEATNTRLSGLSRQAMLSTAECSVLHVPAGDVRLGIVAAETHGPVI
ncbi:NUDIX domain-containing protein [Gulosibacter sp. GYB002]|uniref:NUDIX hydrolase n=1 Tax=Gulosibacter sp. GYB002 TaxID=2994391 RepID=UPI002F96755B